MQGSLLKLKLTIWAGYNCVGIYLQQILTNINIKKIIWYYKLLSVEINQEIQEKSIFEKALKNVHFQIII